MRLCNLFLCALVIAVLSISAASAVVYVKWDAPGPAFDGDSWETAYHTIQQGVDEAVAGDEVWVSAGTYVEKVTLKPNIELYGGFSGVESARNERSPVDHETTIDAGDSSGGSSAVTAADSTVIDGFTITGADRGVYCYSVTASVTGNFIRDNQGLGVFCNGGNIVITDNRFRDNKSYAIYYTAAAGVISRNVIECHPDTGSGGIMWGKDCSLVIADNKTTGGTYGIGGSGAGIVIERNTVTSARIGIFTTLGSPIIRNNVVTDSRLGSSWMALDPGVGITINGGSPIIAGNIVAKNESHGIICHGSPNSVITNNTISDNAGSGFYWEGSSSFSAYNNIITFNQYGVRNSSGSGNLVNNNVYGNSLANYLGLSAGQIDISQHPAFADRSEGDYHIRHDSPCRNAGNNAAPGLPDIDIDGQSRIEGIAVDIGADESFGEEYPRRTVYVKRDSLSNGPGHDWQSAWRTINEAVQHAGDTDEIWIAPGEYQEALQVNKPLVIRGGYSGIDHERDFEAYRTTIRASSGATVISVSASAVIEGLFITGGENGIFCSSRSLTTIANNTISTWGAGIYIGTEGSAEIRHNRILGCTDGISASGSQVTIVNNVIAGNRRDGINTWECTATITNNTIVGNGRGLLANGNGLVTISNNIVAYNSAMGIYARLDVVLRNNCVYGHEIADYHYCQRGPTDIVADPQLVSVAFGDLHIRPSSPCRNAGDNTAPGLGAVDIDGQPRIQGGTVDIGADESHGEVYPATYVQRILRVDDHAAAGGDGSTWDTALDTIQAALDDCIVRGGAEIWVAAGTYAERITMRPFAHLYGGFEGAETWRNRRNWKDNLTIIDAESTGTSNAVTAINMCTLDGFTIRRGHVGVYAYFSNIMIRNNVITDNATYGVYALDYAPRIINNKIITNGDGIYVGWSGYHGPRIINNTIANNSRYGLYNDVGTPDVHNNIIAFNATGIRNGSSQVFIAKLGHNAVYGNTDSNYQDIAPGATDISANPMFINQAAGDYHIHPNSPCRNAGDNNAPLLPAMDIDGQPRIQAGQVDIGADESYGEGVVHNIIRVKHDSPINGPGSEWSNAWRTIGEAMDAALLDDEIWVSAGYYQEKVVMKPGVALKGGYSGVGEQRNIKANVTTIDAANTASGNYTVIAADSVVIDGFTIRGGYYGISIPSGRPLITRNILVANVGGIYCGSGGSARIDANIFESNSTGLTCAGSSPLVTNNIFAGNNGGISCSSGATPMIIGNTVVDSALRGITSISSSPSLINNIVAFNSTGMHFGGAGPLLLLHNNVFGNTVNNYYPTSMPRPTDISVDPQFVNRAGGDYRLQVSSSCIDAGIDNEYLPPLDFGGLGRIFGAAVDIGAHEYQSIAVNLPDLRNISDGTSIRCGGGIVSAIWSDFFYIQSSNRISGIRVNLPGHGLSVGDAVEVTGTMGTMASGERFIANASASKTGSGQVQPAAMNHLTLGGNHVWSWRKVVDMPELQWMRGDGPTNIALLVRTWGRITRIDSSGAFFYIDDGSGIKDGAQIEVAPGVFEDSVGVRVNHSASGLSVGDYLVINGISSCFLDASSPKRLILPRVGELWVVE